MLGTLYFYCWWFNRIYPQVYSVALPEELVTYRALMPYYENRWNATYRLLSSKETFIFCWTEIHLPCGKNKEINEIPVSKLPKVSAKRRWGRAGVTNDDWASSPDMRRWDGRIRWWGRGGLMRGREVREKHIYKPNQLASPRKITQAGERGVES